MNEEEQYKKECQEYLRELIKHTKEPSPFKEFLDDFENQWSKKSALQQGSLYGFLQVAATMLPKIQCMQQLLDSRGEDLDRMEIKYYSR